MEMTIEEPPKNTKKRPEFLTVILILTFIGSGWGILSGIGSIAAKDFLLDNMVESAQMQEEVFQNIDGPLGKMMSYLTQNTQATIDNFVPLLWASIISCVLCLIGAIFMYKLKKVGFLPYAIGEISLPVINIILIGGVMSYIGLFIPILFTIFYAVHLKYMS
jgi:ABC-type multidrug transport system fused ATPase/permease subunit